MKTYLLDTCIVVSYITANTQTENRPYRIVKTIESKLDLGLANFKAISPLSPPLLQHNFIISVVTYAELISLFKDRMRKGKNSPQQYRLVATFIENVSIIEIRNHSDILDAYCELDGFSLDGELLNKRNLNKGPIIMGKNDLWIAATAKVTGAELITIDKDFNHLKEEIALHYFSVE